ncbi:major facilitator superfamily domain-containing protein [Lanmaoa asiatica]|nr:major facilitator superfamily domain-containing protein [Lanmaoa asiatica]
MEGIGGLRGWQWIFCLEGIATVLVALPASFLFPPRQASFLTEIEKRHIIGLLETDSQGLAVHYNRRFVLQALKDYKIYLQFGIIIGLTIPAYGIALFTPTIINELGFSATFAQLLSVPPFVAGCVCTLLSGFFSDRHQLRGPYVIAGPFVAMAGYIILYTQMSPGVSYVGTVLVAMGVYPPIPVSYAWASSNAGGDVKRAVAIAMDAAGLICNVGFQQN